jgi:protein-tyrosine phosphatase
VADRGRRLDWPGVLNARDLGGHPTLDGRRTRWGVVVRSDMLRPMSPEAVSAALAYGVLSVVDLRLPEQIGRSPSPFALAQAGGGLLYRSVPFAGPVDSMLPEFGSLELQYGRMVRAFAAAAPAVLSTVAASDGAVLVHCEYGKDRTGLVCALLLELAGVAREAIADEYAETADCLAAVFEEFLVSGPADRAEREADLARFAPRREVILRALSDVDAERGGVERYLLAAGVPPAVLVRLRERLVGT